MIRKHIIKPLRKTLLLFGFTFLLLEIALAIYTRSANLKIELPTYTLENTQSFWFDNNKHFGTSHLPNHSYRQKKTCFDVLYTTNSHGFRDRERLMNDKNDRVLVIGDSFIEGIGVTANYRLSDLLEKDIGIPHLNYGMAGNFGPTQYYMLYKTLARQFSHDAVLIGILPSNDFIDDDYEINLKVGGNRYRPFLKGDYPQYELVYHVDSLHKSKVTPAKPNVIKKVLKNYTHSYNMFLYLRARARMSVSEDDEILSADEVPTYFNYSTAQLDRIKYVIEQIQLLAGDRMVMVFTIPTYEEITTYRKHRNNPLGTDLEMFCNNQQIEYLDLLPLTDTLSPEECEALFLSCDGHWSEKGNAFAKQQIEKHFKYYNQ